MQRPLRILVGAVDIAGTIPLFAAGFREHGHQVTTLVRHAHSFHQGRQYDIHLDDRSDKAVNGTIPKASRRIVIHESSSLRDRIRDRFKLLRLVSQHDVFLFQWGGRSLTRGNNEFRWLKRFGKKIVSVFMGSDIRFMPFFCELYSDVGFTPELLASRPPAIEKEMRNLRMAEMYSDVILSQPGQSVLAVRPYDHLFLPFDVSQYHFHIPCNVPPVIVHAPSSRDVKGTARILSALDSLRAQGISFELRLLENMSNEQVLQQLSAADIVVDQLYLLNYGKLGLEAMASGCAYATCSREDYEPIPKNRPIMHIQHDNVESQLRKLISDVEFRTRIATRAREFVCQYHKPSDVAARILNLLDAPNAKSHDHNPDLFLRKYNTQSNFKVPKHLQVLTETVLSRYCTLNSEDIISLRSRGIIPKGTT